MMQQQTNDLMRGKIFSATVHPANTIGIAVRHEANVVRMRAEKFLAARVIFLNRFGIDATEQNIVRAVERRDLASRSGQNFFKTTRADAEQSVVRETQF